MTNPSTEGSVDSSQVPPHPMVMGTAALAIHRHSHPLLYSTDGISSCQVTERSHPAVLSVHHHWRGKDPRLRPLDEDLDAGLEADDEGDGEKDPGEGKDPNVDATEIEILQGIINPGAYYLAPALPKPGEKQGSCHLETSIGSDSSAEDLDAKDTQPKKKVSTPVKVASSNTSQWTDEDLNVVRQIHYKTDLDRFQTYQCNKIMPADLSTINTKDHSAYIDIAKVHPSTVIKKSVFSVAAY